jgi:hypothetical protein
MKKETMHIECAQFQEVLPFIRFAPKDAPFREITFAHAETCNDCAVLLLDLLFEIQERTARASRVCA